MIVGVSVEYVIGTHQKHYNNIRFIVVNDKDNPSKNNICGVIYEITCPDCHQK